MTRSRVHFGFREAARHGGLQPNIGNRNAPGCRRTLGHPPLPDSPNLPNAPQFSPNLPNAHQCAPVHTRFHPILPNAPRLTQAFKIVTIVIVICYQSQADLSRFFRDSCRATAWGFTASPIHMSNPSTLRNTQGSQAQGKATTADLYQARAARANYS